MSSTNYTVLLFACLFLAKPAWDVPQEVTPSPETLISRARLHQETWSEGAPPTSLRAELQVSNDRGDLVHGDYTLAWLSTYQWKEAIRIGNYERLRVRDAKGYWQKSTLSYQPEVIFQLDTLLHLKDALKLEPKQTLAKVKIRERGGARQYCTDVKWRTNTDRILCFDEVNGTLASIEYPTGDQQSPREISRIEYGAFSPVAGKLVPYEILALRERKVVASVKILEISKINAEDPARFDVPANSEFWADCDEVREAEVVDPVRPSYPARARAKHEHGRVILYAVIETDGSLSHMALLQRVTPDLETAAMEAVRQWQYKPAACGQTPIRVQTSIAVDFWVGN